MPQQRLNSERYNNVTLTATTHFKMQRLGPELTGGPIAFVVVTLESIKDMTTGVVESYPQSWTLVPGEFKKISVNNPCSPLDRPQIVVGDLFAILALDVDVPQLLVNNAPQLQTSTIGSLITTGGSFGVIELRFSILVVRLD